MSANPELPIPPKDDGAHSLHCLVMLRLSEVFGARFARSRSGRVLGDDMNRVLRKGKMVTMRREHGYPAFRFDG